MKGVWEKHILHHILVSSTLSILSCLPGVVDGDSQEIILSLKDTSCQISMMVRAPDNNLGEGTVWFRLLREQSDSLPMLFCN